MICTTGDVHGSYWDLKNRIYSCIRRKNPGDILAIMGDFGFFFLPGQKEVDRANRIMDEVDEICESRGLHIVFVDGNHENFDILYQQPEVEIFGAPAGYIRDHITHLKRGYVYTIEGNTIFAMGGGISVDKARRQEGISWWPQEMHSYEEQNRAMNNLDAVDWNVDYVFTHSAPLQAEPMLQRAMKAQGDYLNYGKFKLDVLGAEARFHTEVHNRLTFKAWYFGHYHVDYSEGKFHALYTMVKNLS